MGKYVKRIISMGGPQLGVSAVPNIDPTSSLNHIISMCYFKFIQNIVGPCGYIRSLKYDSYKTSGNVIVDLNNEVHVN